MNEITPIEPDISSQEVVQIAVHALHSPVDHCEPCIEPLPQDRRFSAPAP